MRLDVDKKFGLDSKIWSYNIIIMIGMKDKSKLTKKQITDKTGKRTTVWVKTDKEEVKTPKGKEELEVKKEIKRTPEEEKEFEFVKWGDAGFTRDEMEKHQQKAVKALKSHNDTFKQTESEISEMAKGAEIKGRVKAPDSASYKVAMRDPEGKYKGDVKNLKDATGFMVIRDNQKDLDKDIKKLTDKYKVIEKKDYVKNPKDNYRAVHLILQDDSGKMFEVQMKTENQSKWASWNHDIYKPMTDAQAKAIETSGRIIKSYAKKISDYFAKVDSGVKDAVVPACAEAVALTFGCLP
ncbi:MAG: hypothetical protein CMM02_11180 [Rhodopirellula sp.]|nr:hypothetical protein [Rhodopirellula sp.]